MVSRLSRAELLKQAEDIPISSILGKGSGAQLTQRQKKFAREIVKGKSKAQAYRDSYNVTSKATLTSNPYHLAKDSRVQAEIAALEAAERAAAYRTPSRLRALVVETLTQVVVNTEEKTSDRLRAAQLIGQITEVAAFTDRKEVRTISSSETARARVLEEIKSLMASTDDVVDVQAKSLMDELTSESNERSVNITKTQGQDTPAQYDDAQVVDSIRTACQDDDGSTGKDDKNTPDQPITLGGVSGENGQDGDPTHPVPPAV